jgi:hippurate hydrolase
MTIDLSGYAADLTQWRRHIHRHPELAFNEHGTAEFVIERLREFGFEKIATGIAGTGIVATLRAGSSSRAIGLRADMDALPLAELAEHDHVSCNPGVMHACGHDGHTAMLLGAARYLAKNRDFDGTIHFIFQPAEECLEPGTGPDRRPGGANAMIREGLFQRFPMDAIFGIHNRPGLPAGTLACKPGVIYAAADRFEIQVIGKGGHAARPHLAVDPVLVGSHIVVALQGIASRMINPLDSGVLSVCEFHAGTAFNVIPETARLHGTVRSLDQETQALIEGSVRSIASNIASAFGARVQVDYHRGHPAIFNDPSLYAEVRDACLELVGPTGFIELEEPTMGGEDFSNYLREKPGCFLLIGNGELSGSGVMLHNPRYDFNDEATPIGAAFWVTLAQRLLASGKL